MKFVIEKIVYREAHKEDCASIAALYQISSGGVADYVWSQLAEPFEEDLLAVGQRRYEAEDSAFSYRNCTLVEYQGKIIGMLVAFPMQVDPNAQENDPVLLPYSKLEEDSSYYICGMAVLPGYRGLGIGSQLLQLAEQQAQNKGFKKLSLIVFEHNRRAKKLYYQTGYQEVKRELICPHPFIHYAGYALLMVKHINESI